MAFTNDYDTSVPINHTKFIDQPGDVRTLKSDLAERLADMISGFTSGETEEGIKKLIMTALSADPSAITDKGQFYVKDVSGVKELFYIDNNGNVKQLTSNGKLNIEATEAVLLTGDQTIDGVKTFGSIPILPASDPTADNEASRKAYVDAQIAANAFNLSDHLAILTGTISDGGTIPLPDGYTEDQCKWIVGLNGTIGVGDYSSADYPHGWASKVTLSGRTVSIDNYWDAAWKGACSNVVSYMIIGIK